MPLLEGAIVAKYLRMRFHIPDSQPDFNMMRSFTYDLNGCYLSNEATLNGKKLVKLETKQWKFKPVDGRQYWKSVFLTTKLLNYCWEYLTMHMTSLPFKTDRSDHIFHLHSAPTQMCRKIKTEKSTFSQKKLHFLRKKHIIHIILLPIKLLYYFIFLHFSICKIPTISFNYSVHLPTEIYSGWFTF